MARYLLIAAVALALAAPLVQAQAQDKPATPSASTPRPSRVGPKAQREAMKAGPEVENVLRALEALTPEQRLKFKDNFNRWINLSPDEKRAMRDRDESRKRRMVEETEAAIQASGLTLEPGQRAKFAKRYAEERRKIEERLRGEMEVKRKPMVQEVITALRSEFSAASAVAATPVPAR